MARIRKYLLLGALRSGEEPDVLQPLAPKRTANRSHGQIPLSCFQCSAQYVVTYNWLA